VDGCGRFGRGWFAGFGFGVTVETIMITIRHTHGDGTLIEGTAKGDGVFEIVKQRTGGGFVWFPSIRKIGLRGSRDRMADRYRIGLAESALRAAGHAVTVDINDEFRPAVDVATDRAARVAERVDRLSDLSDRADGRADAARVAHRRIAGSIPAGQPILVGHHSEGRSRRDVARMGVLSDREHAERDAAKRFAERADGAAANEAAKHNPRAMARRIETLEASVRRWIRHAAHSRDESYRKRAMTTVAKEKEEIAWLRQQLAGLEQSGRFVPWGPDDFRPGDQVSIGGHWYPVVRVNRKSVTVPPLVSLGSQTNAVGQPWSWTDTATFDKVFGRRRDGWQLDTPHGEPWSVVDADRVARWAGLVAGARRVAQHGGSSDDERFVARRVGCAMRLVHGLSAAASDAELVAFRDGVEDLAERRRLALAYVAVYDRLSAGEDPAGVAASLSPEGEPTWRMPAGEPVDRRIDQLAEGDIVAGLWDTWFGTRRLLSGFCGPVASVSDVDRRGELGDWRTVTLVTGMAQEYQAHQWFAVHPAGAGSVDLAVVEPVYADDGGCVVCGEAPDMPHDGRCPHGAA